MKPVTSPVIHGCAVLKKFTKHGLKCHIAEHRKYKDKELVEKWMQENGDIESCFVK